VQLTPPRQDVAEELDFKAQMQKLNSQVREDGTIKVLLTDTNRWALAARLAVGLAESGCQVSAICPAPSHALMKTRAVEKTFRYSSLRPLESLKAAIESADPDIIVPSCDRSVEHLHELYLWAKTRGSAGAKMATLIEHSLGSPESYAIVSSRYGLLNLAREEGIHVPRTSLLANPKDLDAWQASEPLPWVSKADGTWGGSGVRVIQSAGQAKNSLKELAQISRFSRAIKRLFVNRDAFLLRSWWNRSKRTIILQSYIHGRPANCTVVSWKGRVLAAIGVEVVCSEGMTGPASIVRVIDNPQMKAAAEKIAFRLGLSGFFGLDFMIEEGTGDAFLIEMNPRITPPCHLRLDKGRNLAGALWAQLTGNSLPEIPAATRSEMIAYFPQLLKTDQDVLQHCFQDIPKDEPELVQELLSPFPDRTFLFRLVQWLSRSPVQTESFEAMSGPAVEDLANLRTAKDAREKDEIGFNPLLGKAGDRLK
jgi:carbamoylphosphate synthase large subunit